MTLHLPSDIQDKIFEIRYSNDLVSKIISYFPFSEPEKQEIISLLNTSFFDGFHSIFTDIITNEEWNKTKHQIKQKFKDELFDIDTM